MKSIDFGAGAAILVVVLLGVLYWHRKKIDILTNDLQLFKKAKEYQNEVMMVLREDNSVIYANQAARSLFSLDTSYKKTHHNSNVTLQIDKSSNIGDFFEVLQKKLQSKESIFHLRNVLLGISGKLKQVDIYVSKNILPEENTITCVIDMGNQKANDVDTILHQDGAIDFFTGLPSQFSALTDMNRLIVRSQNITLHFAVCLFGIDRFRELQSTLGLGFTNQVIRKIANYLETKIEDNVYIYKMDADKFLMIVESMSDNDSIRKLVKDTILDIQSLYKQNSPISISVSAGVVRFPADGENALKLINHAYIALGEAQRDNNEKIEFFASDYQTMEKDVLRLKEEIKIALKNNKFVLHYQPIFSLKDETMIGVEALIRWEHSEYGLVSADKFLETAKNAGLMVDIGEYVFNQAIIQRKKWDEAGLDKFKITLNISLEEMQVDTFVERIEALFKQHEANPKDFILDATQKSAMRYPEKTAMDFKLFKDLGLSVSLDNFGLGMISIPYLEKLPLSTIKIDRALIFDLSSSKEHQNIVKSIIFLAHSLGIKVVAEGVETSKEMKFLHEYQCDYAQGYLFSEPLPADELQESCLLYK